MLLFPVLSTAEALDENIVWNSAAKSLDCWFADAWNTAEGYSTHQLADIGYDDDSSLFVENLQDNDARFSQTLWVEPDTLYRVSGYIMAEDCPEEGYGASLSIEDIYVSTAGLHDTAGQWQYVEMYGETGPDQTELTLMARVGNYGSTHTGRAWFDNIEMVPVDSVPDGAMLASFATPAAAEETFDDAEDDIPERNTEALLLIAALFVTLAFAGWATIRRLNEGNPALRGSGEGCILAVLLCAAFISRIYLAVRFPGYRVDINCFEAWGARMLANGPVNFYDPANYFCDYPPLYLMLLAFTDIFRNALGIAYGSSLHGVMVRIWPIVFDILTAALIYRVGRKSIGKTSSAALAALHAFSITSMAISAAWGQADSILALLLSLALLLAIGQKWTPALICYVLAVLTKPQALLFAPIGVAFFIADIVRRPDRRAKLLASAGVAVAAAYLIMLPFSVNLYEGAAKIASPVLFLIELFTGTTGGYQYMTVNALNLYSLLDLNWAHTANHTLLYGFAWLMMAASILYGCALTVAAKDRRSVLIAAAAMMSLIFAFAPMMHERYLYPVIVLMMLFCAMTRDRRVLASAIVFSATLFLNTTLVLQGGMGEGNYGHLQSSEQWINAVISFLNVANALYLAFVAFRICVQNRISTHKDRAAEHEPPEGERLHSRKDARLRLTKKDYLLMIAVSLIYAVVAFTNLGVMQAPQTEWTSTEAGEAVIFDLGEETPFRMTYYGGICNTHFTVALSNDGVNWSEDFHAEYNQGNIFRWLYYVPQTYSSGSFSNAYGETEINLDAPQTYFAGEVLPDELAAFDHSAAYPPQQARYVRITASAAGLKLREIGFLNAAGKTLPVREIRVIPASDDLTDDAAKLIDEQAIVAAEPSYLNGTYFDEIYHARTAYEHQQGMTAYEWTHPPLGKVLIMVGINIFGMTPFGWRFMGTLIGVLMLPVMYLLAKQLTRRTSVACVAMLLMALDSMHFTQTRIATVDSFAVFFIMLMYLFMFRYQQMNWNHDGLKRTLIPLGLCGVTMGLGIATKWIGVYAAIGLAVIFFCTLWKRFAEYRYAVRNGEPADDALTAQWPFVLALTVAVLCVLIALIVRVLPEISFLPLYFISREACITVALVLTAAAAVAGIAAIPLYRARRTQTAERTAMQAARTDFWRNAILTCLFCLIFFIVIPLLIYYFSYYWQLRGEINGLNISRVIGLQESMFSYHAGLGGDTHYFRSPWYEWPIIWWPIWYYSGTGFMPDGVISSISCMGNPAVWWTGLIALFAVLYFLAARKRKPDSYHLVVIGFLSQFLPWVLVPRSTFIYHYFASVPFIILCTALMLDRIRRHSRRAFRITAVLLVSAALILFIMFYPLESGLPAPRAYANLLRWFSWYNF